MFGQYVTSDTSINIDGYEVNCGCGQHIITIHVDMYHIAGVQRLV